MSKAEREVATATVSQGRVICPKCGSSDSTLPHTTGNGIAYNCSRCWLVFTPPSLPEAVAGNASAPVGEKMQPSGVQQVPVQPSITQRGKDDGSPVQRDPANGPDSDLAGQPSGVGEPPIKKFQVLMDRMVGVYRVAVEPVPSPLQPLQAIAQEQANQAWFIEQAISEKLEREK